jgi:hypothetical protein
MRPMPRINERPHREVQRTDTLTLRTRVKYDPMAPRITTPVMVGRYVVHRKPLLGQLYTLYLIMDGADIARTQISYPSEGDCATALHASKNAKRIAAVSIGKAKKGKKGWQAKPMKIREAA